MLVTVTNNKNYFFFVSNRCVNRAVKAFWIAELFQVLACIPWFIGLEGICGFFLFLEVMLGKEFLVQSYGIGSIQCKIILKLEINSIITALMYLDINVLTPEVLNLLSEMAAM